MSGFQLPFGVKPVNPIPVDYYSGPYISNTIQDALDQAYVAIPQGIRFKTMEVRLIVNNFGLKYWFKDGIENTDLIEFVTAPSSFYIQGGTTQSYNTISDIYRTGSLTIGTSSLNSSKLYIYATQSGAFRLEDGSQGDNYILKTLGTSGVATWTSSTSPFYVQGGTTYSHDTTSDIYRTGSLNIGTGTATDGRFVVSSSTGSVSLVVDEFGNVYNNKGFENTVFGYQALLYNTDGVLNTALGQATLFSNTLGSYNSAVGYNSLALNQIGNYNTALGYYSLYANIGDNNTTIGYDALSRNMDGVDNVSIGKEAGTYFNTGNTNYNKKTDYSIFIGSNSRAQGNTQSNQIVIGYNAIGNGSDSVTLGNDNITKTILRGNIGIGLTGPSTKLHIYATQSGAFRLQDGTQAPGYVLTSDTNGLGTWQGNPQITLNGPTATALASWNNTTVMSNFSATCSITIPDTGLPPNFSFRFMIISGNSGSTMTFTYSSPVSILPNTLLTFAQYESGVIDRYGTSSNYYITY
jgi:hypothetical protein